MVKDNSLDYTMTDGVEGKGEMKFVLLRFGLTTVPLKRTNSSLN